jgi:hypothetical protein
MYCSNCGKELSGGEFCNHCGTSIDAAAFSKEELLRIRQADEDTFIGERNKSENLAIDGYHFEKIFAKMRASGRKIVFSLSPIFIGGVIFLYRKMYKQFIIWYLLTIVWSVLSRFLLSLFISPDSALLPLLQSVAPWLSLWAVALFYNYIYMKHVEKSVTKITKLNLSPDEKEKMLKKKGGTSIKAAIIAILLYLVVLILFR